MAASRGEGAVAAYPGIGDQIPWRMEEALAGQLLLYPRGEREGCVLPEIDDG
jgi:hypothetical protein